MNRNGWAGCSGIRSERAGVYLTNALTGWEPPKEPKDRLPFPEFEQEREAADRVKQETPILVILGNPPYNAFAGTSPAEEQGLVDVYKEGLNKPIKDGGWGIKKFNLDELYVRFFRLAERRIAEVTGRGIVCFISNFSYLGDPSFVVMRQKLLKDFDKIWIDCLNGDSRETGKLTPDGKPDPSVFSTEYNREGIKVGTAVGLLVKKQEKVKKPEVRFREFWGTEKRHELVNDIAEHEANNRYKKVMPAKINRYSFRNLNISSGYLEWPNPVELCKEEPISGLQEMRKGSLMDIDKKSLINRIKTYFDKSIGWDQVKEHVGGIAESAGRFDPKKTRKRILNEDTFSEENVIKYSMRPYDDLWCYYSAIRPLWNEPRPALRAQHFDGNKFIITRMISERPFENIVLSITPNLPDYHLLRPNAVAIPVLYKKEDSLEDTNGQKRLNLSHSSPEQPSLNLSNETLLYLTSLGYQPSNEMIFAEKIWMNVLSISFSQNYLTENSDGIKTDWPRIPLPNKKELLESSAEIGRKLAVLLEPTSDASPVMSGLSPLLNTLGNIRHLGEGPLDPAKGHLALTAGWGHAGQNNVTMPGRGDARERAYEPEEQEAISTTAKELGITDEQALELLGQTTYDIYLNEVACWKNVPSGVWNYYIGGYQVIKKWLSYREKKLLGRNLKPEEARYVTDVIRRLASIILLGPELDDNYQDVKANCFDWQSLAD